MWYTLVYNDLITGRKEPGLFIYGTSEAAQLVADEANKDPTSPNTYYTVAEYPPKPKEV